MPQEEASPSTSFAEAVRAIVTAWRSLVAYPAGHPAAGGALQEAHRRIEELTASEGCLLIGVSQAGLRFAGARLASPHARILAEALHQRQIAVLRIEPGIEESELERLCRLFETDPRGGPGSAPPGASGDDNGPTHLFLQAVDYSALTVTDELRPASARPATEREAVWDRVVGALMTRAQMTEELESLWDGIVGLLAEVDAPAGARLDMAALFGEVEAGGAATRMAEALGTRLGEALGPRAGTAVPARPLAARQVADFVRRLPEPIRQTVLRSVLGIVAADEGGAAILHAFSTPFRPPTILQALADLDTTGVRLSSHALDLIRVLPGLGEARAEPLDSEEGEDVAALVTLYRREDIDRYNPEDHQALFAALSVEVPPVVAPTDGSAGGVEGRLESITDEALAEQLTQTLLEMLIGLGPGGGSVGRLVARLENLYRLFLTSGRPAHALQIVDTLIQLARDCGVPSEVRLALRSCLEPLGDPEALAALVASLADRSGPAMRVARQLVDRLGAVGIRSLVLLLAEEPSLSRRRRTFDLLVAIGPPVTGHAMRWLSHQQWYVVRNMIALLRAVGNRDSLPQIRRHAFHPDLRVRLEALKSLIMLDAYESREVVKRAINDRNPKVAEVVVALVGRYGTPDMVPALLDVVARWDLFGARRGVRLRALWSLGELGDPRALPPLSRFLRHGIFRLVAREERRAAYQSLEGYAEAERWPLVQKGLRSRDPVIRELCRRLATPP